MCSQGHQNLREIGSPQTKQCINAYRKNSKEKKRAAINKQNNQQQNEQNWIQFGCITVYASNNIKSENELFAIAGEQKKAGKKDLANFVLPCSTNALRDLLKNIHLEDEICKQKSFLLKTNMHESDS